MSRYMEALHRLMRLKFIIRIMIIELYHENMFLRNTISNKNKILFWDNIFFGSGLILLKEDMHTVLTELLH